MEESHIFKLLISLLLAVAPSVLLAQALPENTKFKVYSDFSGGMNTSDVDLADNEAVLIKNAFIDEINGSLVSRYGYTLAGSTTGLQSINFLMEYILDDGSREFIVSDSSVVLATTDFSSYKILKTGLNTNSKVRGTQIYGKAWLTNGVDDVFTYNGTTVTELDGNTYASGKTPNVPKGKYIAFHNGIVFTYNHPNNNSQVIHSAVASTQTVPVALAPDSEWAWPNDAERTFYVGRGDGEVGTAMFSHLGTLYFGKEKSLYRLFGFDETEFVPVLVSRDIGIVSHETVSFIDGVPYFLGKNGVYELNGIPVPASNKIKNDITRSVNNVSRIVANTWDVQSEFARGSFSGTTVTASGILTIWSTNSFRGGNFTDVAVEPSNGLTNLTAASTSTHFTVITPTNTIENNFLGYVSRLKLWNKSVTGNGIDITFYNKRTGGLFSFFSNVQTGSSFGRTNLDSAVNSAGNQAVLFTGSDLNNGNLEMRIELNGSSDFFVYLASATGSTEVVLSPASTGQFLADITTVTTITFWDSLNSEQTTNGGAISYFVRTATSSVNIATYPWVAITPGSVINSSASNNYIQWASTISAVSAVTPPEIDRVDITHNEGQASVSSPFSTNFDGRYLTFISSQVSGDSFHGYMRSKNGIAERDSYVMVSDIPIFSIANLNGNIYGGGTNGRIYRLFTGTNDNGSAIDTYVEWAGTYLDNPIQRKRVPALITDFKAVQGGVFTVGVSTNNGDFGRFQISMDGSGRNIKWEDAPHQLGDIFRFSLRANQIDKRMEFYKLIVPFVPTGVLTDR